MAFKLAVSKESIEGNRIVVPAGIYKLKLLGFKPKFSKPNPNFLDKPASLNLNAQMEVTEHPEFEKTPMIFEGLNMNAGWILQDFCHAFGFPLEPNEDGSEGGAIPGTWDSKPDFDPSKAETYFYVGPLTGRIAQVEVYEDSYNGKPSNKVSRYFCSVDDCATKFPEITHREDLRKKS